MCNRERLPAAKSYLPSLILGTWSNRYFSPVFCTKYHTKSICSLSFQPSSWTEIQLDQIWWPFWRTKSLHFRAFITHPSVHRLCDLVSFLYGLLFRANSRWRELANNLFRDQCVASMSTESLQQLQWSRYYCGWDEYRPQKQRRRCPLWSIYPVSLTPGTLSAVSSCS